MVFLDWDIAYENIVRSVMLFVICTQYSGVSKNWNFSENKKFSYYHNEIYAISRKTIWGMVNLANLKSKFLS